MIIGKNVMNNYQDEHHNLIQQFLKNKSLFILMTIIANLILFYSIHLLNTKFCEAFPSVISKTEKIQIHSDNDNNNLRDLVNSFENKQIFSQLKYSENAFYDKDLNVVGTIKFPEANQYQKQPYVANGYIGSRIPNLGQGFTYDQLGPGSNEDDLYNGWPLFDKRYAGAFIAGFYDLQENTTGTNFPELLQNGYESIISAIPQWTTLKLLIEHEGKNYTLDPTQQQHNITNYVQNMSLSNGIVTTQFTWLDSLDVKYTVLAHRTEINLGYIDVAIQNRLNESVSVMVIDELDFDSAQRCELDTIGHDDSGIYVTFSPINLDYVHGAIYSTLHTNSLKKTDKKAQQMTTLQIEPLDYTHVSKTVGIVSSDLGVGDVLSFAKNVSQRDPSDIINSHISGWEEKLGEYPLIEIPSDPLLNLGAKASIYHLLANSRPNAQGLTGALGVGGLSSDSYGGMVFWDTDLWMFRAILPLNPTHARSIVNYRMHTREQAIKNVPQGYEGAVYPWTSGRFGNCTATGPCLNYEYHINTNIAMAAWQLYLSGAADDNYLREVAFPIVNDAAKFFSSYVTKYNDTFDKYVTYNLTDPDEYANHVDNGAYTNSGIALLMDWINSMADHLGEEVPNTYRDISNKMFLPTANNSQNITLEYSGMNSSVGIKQADVIMLTYPLGNNLINTDQAYINMEFYSQKQVSYGPAMTFSIFSIVASNLAETGCASQSYLHKAIQPYLRGPFAQFSEQNNDNYTENGGTHPAFPFLTAHGGFLQALMQGLTGMRHTFEVNNRKISRVLHFDPISIPCLGEGIQYNSIHYDNHTLSFNLTSTDFTIKNNGKIDNNANDFITISLAARNPKSGKFKLKDNESVTLPLFKPSNSFPDSISECGDATFYNITEGAPGDSSFSINDGDNTTRWQVRYNDTVGKVLIDLHSIKNISSVVLNWGDKPPKSMKLLKYIGSKFNSVTDFLSKVDFGNKLYKNYKFANPEDKLYNQSELFEEIHSNDVEISEPFSESEYQEVLVPTRHNVTILDLKIESRFLLLEVEKIHNTIPIEDDYGGAKLAEIVFY
ncbi:ATH1 [Candida jiufengensis]|uniref:ATH1 n=1 Tax=Candida jiufengensis TaxID=497108 RepID=UPI002225903B|nr:ATH1 [Candida jiufengensis]KAI5951688.1 ATH1 [Candida jiufengensis]